MTLPTEWKMNSRGRSRNCWHLCMSLDRRYCHRGSSSGEGENLVDAGLVTLTDELPVGRAGQKRIEDEPQDPGPSILAECWCSFLRREDRRRSLGRAENIGQYNFEMPVCQGRPEGDS